MRTIHRLIEAKKAQREEEGKDAGFSLIELIIVIVILGILVAIAIPLIGNLQTQALKNSAQAAAANAATQASAQITQNATATLPTDASTATEFTMAWNDGTTTTTTVPTKVEDVCVTATAKDDTNIVGKSGPGC
ncbi:type IV pilus assembly protein PilA [Microbacterium sp. W4I4]|uniref:prepilin-type N-terminal cleavage/methylation domain-containing protein n=1 Tax=Microbacterium sp. W4I4 TaxID=3042295 RepID=UPI00278275A0|nr:prepilin-type N-terminal cleavage/methylation domain-containing protein [Microbacterium sp. W4I4]MDQ0614914.1 type IV pilus assembly protein PilA [Microbacterium sp. W4I4]